LLNLFEPAEELGPALAKRLDGLTSTAPFLGLPNAKGAQMDDQKKLEKATPGGSGAAAAEDKQSIGLAPH